MSDDKFLERMEAFSNDLIALFNKHHMAMLWKAEDLLSIDSDAFVEGLGRREFDEDGELYVFPICSKVDWDKLIKLEGDVS